MLGIPVISCIAVAILVVVILLASYVKAPPSWAFIVSGISHKPRTYIGKGGFRIPGFERLDRVFLGQITVDIKTNRSVPTKDFINVNVDAVAKIQVINNPDGIRLAAKNFLNMTPEQISRQVQDSLEGNMRECVGGLSLRDININRDAFSDAIMEKAQKDMNALGLDIISCNIQNVTDDKNLIEDLGADNTWTIKKQAQINKATAQKEIRVAEAKAQQESVEAEVSANTKIAERQNDLSVKKSELAVVANTKQAVADAAYAIEKAQQDKVVNIRTVEAETEKVKKEQDLTLERVQISENILKAKVNKQAEADKFATETKAAAELTKIQREADAARYEAEQEAKATIAKAEARKAQMILEADGIKAQGEAEAYAIEKKGEAEAKAMEKKALAYEKYGQAAILDMLVKVLPEVSSNVAGPIGNIKDLTIYGTSGQEAAGISGVVPTVVKQSFDVIESATGVNMGKLIEDKSHIASVGIDK